jgi:hypothetical protein
MCKGVIVIIFELVTKSFNIDSLLFITKSIINLGLAPTLAPTLAPPPPPPPPPPLPPLGYDVPPICFFKSKYLFLYFIYFFEKTLYIYIYKIFILKRHIYSIIYI